MKKFALLVLIILFIARVQAQPEDVMFKNKKGILSAK